MTTSISIPSVDYNRAKNYAQMRNLSIDDLQKRIDEGEAQFERGEYVTHEQMMAELKEEFPWLK